MELENIGQVVHGVLRSSDASSGVEVSLYDASNASVTISASQRLLITDAHVTSDDGGELHLFIGADATPGNGETVLRGKVAASGGLMVGFQGTPRLGILGGKPYLVAAAGIVNVVLTGRIYDS